MCLQVNTGLLSRAPHPVCAAAAPATLDAGFPLILLPLMHLMHLMHLLHLLLLCADSSRRDPTTLGGTSQGMCCDSARTEQHTGRHQASKQVCMQQFYSWAC